MAKDFSLSQGQVKPSYTIVRERSSASSHVRDGTIILTLLAELLLSKEILTYVI